MITYDTENQLTENSIYRTKFSDNKNIFNPKKIVKYYLDQTINFNKSISTFEDKLFSKHNYLSSNNLDHYLYEEIDYKPYNEIFDDKCVLFEDLIELKDVKSNANKNNRFLSVLALITQYPVLINNLFPSKILNSTGYFEVLLFIEGEWQIVVVDSKLPVKKGTNDLYFSKSHNNELWVILLEKAWCKVNGGYLNAVASSLSDIFLAITGFQSDILNNKSCKDLIWGKVLANKLNFIYTGSNSSKDSQLQESYGLISSHSYLILSCEEANIDGENIRLILLRNPWGYKGWTGAWSETSHRWTNNAKKAFQFDKKTADGGFFMDYDDFIHYFTTTCICYFQSDSYFKTFSLTKDKFDLKSPLIFNFYLEESLTTGLSLFKKGSTSSIIHLIYSRYEDTNTINYMDGMYSVQDFSITKTFQKGHYVVWIYINDDSGNDVKNSVKFRISSKSLFKIKYYGNDIDFTLLKNLLVLGVSTDSLEEKEKNGDLLIKHRTEYKKTGIGYHIVTNKSKTNYLIKANCSHLMNIRLLYPYDKSTESLEDVCEANKSIVIIGIIENPSISSLYLEANYEQTDTIASKNTNGKNETLINQILSRDFEEDSEHNSYDYYLSDFHFDHELKINKTLKSQEIFKILKADHYNQMMEILKFKQIDDGITTYWSEISEYENGSYIGEVNELGERHGRGFINYNTGDFYIGQWKHDEKSGDGEHFYEDGKIMYRGEYLLTLRNGNGSLFLENGDHYEGQFKNDRYNGLGVYYWNNNISWIGNFVDDKFHGVGMFILQDGKFKLREFDMGIVKTEFNVEEEHPTGGLFDFFEV